MILVTNAISTGESRENDNSISHGGYFTKNSDTGEARLQGYESFLKSTGSEMRQQHKFADGKLSPEDSLLYINEPSKRYAIKKSLEDARESVSALQKAIQDEDYMERAVIAIGFMDLLQKLWQLREVRTERWAMILNFLQSSLADEVFENLSIEKSKAVRNVVDRYLSKADITADNVDAAIYILENGGLDPFRAISLKDGR